MDQTARGDAIADIVRQWYEANRETWWQRFTRPQDCADDFMLGLIHEVNRIQRDFDRIQEELD